uniref:L27-1 domain-containing protein n=1 Tax=Sarcophilus harrisii TaxID=9305 RepID=A0A7N4PC26_SARHA
MIIRNFKNHVFTDTDRALRLLEEYCRKLRKPEEQPLKKAVKKAMGIFKSSLFQALLGIQIWEFMPLRFPFFN